MFELFPSRTVALQLFGWPLHWYGVLYLAAFLLASWLVPRLQRFRALDLPAERWSSVVAAAVLGVVAGGRLGYVLFYDPAHFAAHPLDIFKIWQGGMSSHGGLAGVTVALWWTLRDVSAEERLKIADIAVIPAAIGLALGRFGNFINQELYGTLTSLPWGIAIPGVEGLRHPTSLYAVGKDLLIALLCFWHLVVARPFRSGRTLALFLMLYGVFRFLLEFLRVPTHDGLTFGLFVLTRGQALTLPLILAGGFLWWWAGYRLKRAPR
jgi:phosphatidylglycerol:prolipoprotein diacylglycerol transferase